MITMQQYTRRFDAHLLVSYVCSYTELHYPTVCEQKDLRYAKQLTVDSVIYRKSIQQPLATS